MAARDRNLFAWQAYVVATSIISVLLLVLCFLLWKWHSDLLTRYAEQTNQLNTSKNDLNKATMRVDRLKSMLGYGTATADAIKFMVDSLKDDPEMGEIEKNYAVDMSVFSSNVEKRDYREFPRYLLDAVRARNVAIADASEKVNKLTQEKEEVRAREQAAREKAEKAQKTAEDELAAARAQHATELSRVNQNLEKSQAMVSQFKKDLETKNAQLDNERKALQAETNKQKETIQAQTDKIKLLIDDDFEEPAGKVTRVANGGQTSGSTSVRMMDCAKVQPL